MSFCASKTLSGIDGLSQIGSLISDGTITAVSFSTGSGTFQYAEGPLTLTVTSDGVSDMSITQQSTFFVRVGRHITVSFALILAVTAVPSPGTLTLQGFPTGPDICFGSCELLQFFDSIVSPPSFPIQGMVVDGNMIFFPAGSNTPILTDLSQDSKPIIGSITYVIGQPNAS